MGRRVSLHNRRKEIKAGDNGGLAQQPVLLTQGFLRLKEPLCFQGQPRTEQDGWCDVNAIEPKDCL